VKPPRPNFTCPTCAAAGDADLTWAVDTITELRYPQVELWPGGPTYDDRSAIPRPHPVDRVLSTSACEHTFKLTEWAWAFHHDGPAGASWMTVDRRAEPVTVVPAAG
jgi:hypothetical protein